MPKPKSTATKFFSGIARIYRLFRSIILNLLFIFLFLVFLGSLIGNPPVVVPQGAALVVNPRGSIVDQLTYADPLEALIAQNLGQDIPAEVLLDDLLDAIGHAARDDAISAMVLVLDDLQATGFSKLREVARALTDFHDRGKRIYAVADSYSQGQYYLAAFADEIIINPMGVVDLEGLSTYQMYYRGALDKLGVNVNVFRVGEYKSAVEPYERNDMSPEAREANMAWLTDLWRQYVDDVSEVRDFDTGYLDEFINNMDTHLAGYDGDFAAMAQGLRLVDNLADRDDITSYLRQEIGADGDDGFLSIAYRDYLGARGMDIAGLSSSPDKIGIIVARGQIYDGSRHAGEVGGDSLQALIRQARLDDDIKALVLRIDSPGGSAFASEIIRGELERFTADGKPLVVSMGSVAASGGYWIATPADRILASASTITGSIGIYGILPTFEDSLAKIGISTDGVGTTELAGALAVGRTLPPLARNVIQLNLENGYDRFLGLVAESRNMTVDEVDTVARGRVWSGEQALALGLVDGLGDQEQAVAAAAELAQLSSYDTVLIEQQLTPGQQLIQELSDGVLAKTLTPALRLFTPERDYAVESLFPAPFAETVSRRLQADIRSLFNFNDPNGLYLQCPVCSQAPGF